MNKSFTAQSPLQSLLTELCWGLQEQGFGLAKHTMPFGEEHKDSLSLWRE